MAKNESENTVLWIIGGLFVVVGVMVGIDHFHQPAPRVPVTPAVAAPAQPTAPTQTATTPEHPGFNPRAVMEDPEFADVAPKLPPGVKVPSHMPVPRDPGDQMRGALKALILSQEIFMADNNFMRYATRMDELKEMPVIPGVTVTLRSGGQLAYVAGATHVKRPGKQCALYVGTPPMPPAKVMGQIGCN